MEREIFEGDDLINVIIKIPRGAVKLKMQASMLYDGKLQTAEATFDNEDIREMRQAFIDNVDDGDEFDKFWCLTEEGRKYIEGLIEGLK